MDEGGDGLLALVAGHEGGDSLEFGPELAFGEGVEEFLGVFEGEGGRGVLDEAVDLRDVDVVGAVGAYLVFVDLGDYAGGVGGDAALVP